MCGTANDRQVPMADTGEQRYVDVVTLTLTLTSKLIDGQFVKRPARGMVPITLTVVGRRRRPYL